jgi:hypothetical protein
VLSGYLLDLGLSSWKPARFACVRAAGRDGLTPLGLVARSSRVLRVCYLVLVLLFACAPDPGDLGPTEALAAFLTAVERSTHMPEQRKLAFEWLDRQSQEALAERARLTNSLAGRKLAPWEMLVPGRVSFAGQSIAGVRMTANVDGDHATVSLVLEKPVDVPMKREQGRWRVVLGLNPSP